MKSFGYILTLVLISTFTTVSISQIPDFGLESSDGISSDTTKTKFFTIFNGNPGRATLYSLLLPGAGQLYNKRWWKLPLVYGLEGAAIYFWLDNRRTFNSLDECYISLIDDDLLNSSSECTIGSGSSERTISDQATAFQLRNRVRNRKETAFLLSIGAHLFQTLEAFIDRHLIDFDVDEDLTFKLGPTELTPNTFNNQSVTIITIGFPLDR